MPLEIGVWRIDDELTRLEPIQMDKEARLEELLAQDIAIANRDWMVIGKQVTTDHGGRIDILALDSVANLIVIELKRQETPREIVAQVLDYGSWVSQLTSDRVGTIYQDYREKSGLSQSSLDAAFREVFGHELPAEHPWHELVIVAASLDPATERIVNYLADAYGVNINVLSFQIFTDGERQYLARTWVRDPNEINSEKIQRIISVWNKEYYVAFGEDNARNWQDALEYGFISAGGGDRYTRLLRELQVGDRVWVHLLGEDGHRGYAGVGRVITEAVPAIDYAVDINGECKKLSEILGDSPEKTPELFAPEAEEYLVRIEWLHKESRENVVWERGFFANQNVVARPGSGKWDFTVGRLKELWNIDD